MKDAKEIGTKRKRLFRVLGKGYSYLILLLMIFLFLFAGFEYFKDYFDALKDPEKIRILVMSYGRYSVLAFIGVQILQVIVFFIPGEVVQISGGYIYGVLNGSLISLIGITIGSSFCFFISNIYGKKFVNKFISKNKLKYFEEILAYKRIRYIVFMLYLIPGIPKDVLAYICGVSELKFKDFFIYSTIGRLPGIIISAYFGERIIKGDYFILVLISVVMTILFLIGVFKGEKIINNIHKAYERK